MRLVTFALALILMAVPSSAGPNVITSVMPVYGIVSAVMGDVGQPKLLLQGKMSEHRASFTPAQVAALGEADIVFIVGHGLETKLAQMSGTEAVNGKAFVLLSEVPGVVTRPIRQGGTWEPRLHQESGADEHDHDAHEGVLAYDPHVWLDPENAKAMATVVAMELAKIDPEHAATYQANATTLSAQIDRTTAEIAVTLASVKDRPFVVFHDAYQYFEARFGLTGVGSISDVSALAPSAERLQEVRDKIMASHAACVFREPQYDSKTVDVVIEGTGARSGVLDPIGAGLTPGPDVYPKLLSNLAGGLLDCLGG